MLSPASDLRDELAGFDGTVRAHVPLARFTHVRVGGPAELLVEPASETDVVRVVRTCRDRGLSLRVLGAGSNLLIADEGVEGVVLWLGGLDDISHDGNRVAAGAGAPLARLLRVTRDVGLAGLETLTGIPAHVGGAVAMNAGTRDGETFDRLSSLALVDAAGDLAVVGRRRFAPCYRDGGTGSSIVVRATFELEPDDPQAIRERFEVSLARRNATQPVAQRSAGCVFRNPEGVAAAQLIDEAGCKGLRCGGIVVSDKHANYFINEGRGTASEFLGLIEAVVAKVARAFGVELEPEIKVWRS